MTDQQRDAEDDEDDDHTRFVQFEGLRAEGRDDDAILSLAAFNLHGHGMRNSISDGDPGFISDDYLNAISAETSITAAELCTSGLWCRVDGGYEVLDDEMYRMSLDGNRRMRRMQQCEDDLGGHREDPNSGLCSHCGINARAMTEDDE